MDKIENPVVHDLNKLWETNWELTKFKDPKNDIAYQIQEGDLKVEEAVDEYPHDFISYDKFGGNAGTDVGLKALIYWAGNGAGSGASFPSAPSPSNLFNKANANLMVSANNAAAAHTDTYSTMTSPAYHTMDTSFPDMAAAWDGTYGWVVTWQATYESGTGEIAWESYAVANAGSTPVILNRFASSKGTKGSGESWTLACKIGFK